jgi:hypothetical protein
VRVAIPSLRTRLGAISIEMKSGRTLYERAANRTMNFRGMHPSVPRSTHRRLIPAIWFGEWRSAASTFLQFLMSLPFPRSVAAHARNNLVLTMGAVFSFFVAVHSFLHTYIRFSFTHSLVPRKQGLIFRLFSHSISFFYSFLASPDVASRHSLDLHIFLDSIFPAFFRDIRFSRSSPSRI